MESEAPHWRARLHTGGRGSTETEGEAPLRNNNERRRSATRRARLHGKEKGTTETGERGSKNHCGERGSNNYGERGSVYNPRNWRARLHLQNGERGSIRNLSEASGERGSMHRTRHEVPRGSPALPRREFNLAEKVRDLARVRPTLRRPLRSGLRRRCRGLNLRCAFELVLRLVCVHDDLEDRGRIDFF